MNYFVKAFSSYSLTYHSQLKAPILERNMMAYCTVPFRVIGPRMNGYANADGSFTFEHKRNILSNEQRTPGKLSVTILPEPNGSAVAVHVEPPMFSAFVAPACFFIGSIISYASCSGVFNSYHFFVGTILALVIPLGIVGSNNAGMATLVDNFATQFDLTCPN